DAGRDRGGPPRLLHVEPRPPRGRRHRRAAAGGPARRGRARRGPAPLPRRPLARPRPPRRPAGLRCRPRGAARRDPAGAGRLPGHAGSGDGVRRDGRPRRPGPRRRGADRARRARCLRGAPAGLRGRAVPLADRRRPPRLPRGHRDLRGAGAGRAQPADGRAAHVAPAGGRAVPPRVGAVGARRRPGRELPGVPLV
ncbi:MAG: Anthranilate synthase, amidotransferase component @ Para-aminobenzoate synthase, amidotransferase component, partial [uncultured Nocardioides sp.]